MLPHFLGSVSYVRLIIAELKILLGTSCSVEKMAVKTITKMEVLKGFIRIPTESRDELFGNFITSTTLLNEKPARLDKYGRIWSTDLKNKFSIGTRVKITRTESGFFVSPLEESEESTATPLLQEKKTSASTGGNEPLENLLKSDDVTKTIDKLFFNFDSIRIYNDDFLKTDALLDNSIDLVVTSPPYNVDIQYENYKDDISYDEYLRFTEKWLAKCYGLAKDDGRLCLNIPLDKNKGGQQSVCADITTITKRVGWKYHATIIWNEQNISRRTAWGSWMSASAPFVIAPVEVILVLYKKNWQKRHGSRKSDITRDEFLSWTNGVWNFSGESRNRIGHPAPFPIELPRRCIKLFSYVGDTVLDPFLGSGSTLIACVETGRAGIGVEINKNYCELAKKRLATHSELYQQKLA
jgi:site-specific DNA-methyltransferase (adenine-specific)